MPELAEVETVRRVLKKDILNKKIIDIFIYYPKMIENNPDDFKNKLLNTEFIDIKRIGKYLLFETNNYYLISHLRMEGKYYLKDNNEIKGKHEHIKIVFANNLTLRYEDTRKFGRMTLINKEDLNNTKCISKQGIEANSKDLTGKYIYDKIHKKNLAIKTLLLDQTIISGLGNIYADEVLFKSFINPNRKGRSLSLEECKLLAKSSKEIINKAIIYGGTTIRSYTSSLGVKGRYQKFLNVHTKNGEKCLNCGSIIQKVKIGGRSTYYCDNCQK